MNFLPVGWFRVYTPGSTNIAVAGKWGPRIEPIAFLSKTVIFQWAMLVYQRVVLLFLEHFLPPNLLQNGLNLRCSSQQASCWCLCSWMCHCYGGSGWLCSGWSEHGGGRKPGIQLNGGVGARYKKNFPVNPWLKERFLLILHVFQFFVFGVAIGVQQVLWRRFCCHCCHCCIFGRALDSSLQPWLLAWHVIHPWRKICSRAPGHISEVTHVPLVDDSSRTFVIYLSNYLVI